MTHQENQTTCINPATGEIIGHSPLSTVEDVKQAVQVARDAQPAWADLSMKARTRMIRNIRDYVLENADELAATISKDNGKTPVSAMVTEVTPTVMAIDYYCRKAEAFLKDRHLGVSSVLFFNKNSRLVRVPLGVVGIVSPWNYPFMIPFSEVIMGLVTGNAVVLKVASETQMVGRAIERCVAAAGLPKGIFTHINIPGREAGPALLDAGVDKLFFTGSVSVGKILMEAAAKTLTPLVLELGGNDPMVVCADADLDRAATGAVWAGFENCGQTCGAVERIYVHQSVYEPFLKRLAEKVESLRVGIGDDSDLGSMTTARQRDEVERQVKEAVAAGATIYAESKVPDGEKGYYLPARVLTDVNHDMDVMRLETFGPVVCVMPVGDMEEAVRRANDSDLGLTASVWSKGAKAADRIARRIKAGVVMINDHLMSCGMPETPWGGFRNSGIGRTHGNVGIEEMTELQCIVHDNMPFVKKNFWWFPTSQKVYEGTRGTIRFLHGKSWQQRLTGLKKLLSVYPRTFKR